MSRDEGMIDCRFCGHHFEAYLGKYGCPNCQADETLQVTVYDALAHLPRARWAAALPKANHEETRP